MNLLEFGHLPTTLLGWLDFLLHAFFGPVQTLIYMKLDIVERVREFKFGEKRIPKRGGWYG